MYKLTNHNSIKRLSDNATIPPDPANRDYAEYLEWVAAGNNPLPVDPPTTEQIIAEFTNAIQQRLDDFARTRGYTSNDSISKYKDITEDEIVLLPADEQVFVRKFKTECRYLSIATSRTWSRCYLIMDEVMTGTRPMPTLEEVEAELPTLFWPA
jgi:fructose-specific phosphotransferase system component IIB